ncbi:hypothetical protein NHJ13734_000445 [Beauveria thailandica]
MQSSKIRTEYAKTPTQTLERLYPAILILSVQKSDREAAAAHVSSLSFNDIVIIPTYPAAVTTISSPARHRLLRLHPCHYPVNAVLCTVRTATGVFGCHPHWTNIHRVYQFKPGTDIQAVNARVAEERPVAGRRHGAAAQVGRHSRRTLLEKLLVHLVNNR